MKLRPPRLLSRLLGRDSANPVESLEREDIFYLIKDTRRRYALHYLKREARQSGDRTVALADLVDQVTAWEHDTTVEAIDPDDRRNVYIGLVQNHLPALADASVIEFDKDGGTVTLTPAAAALDVYVRPVRSDDLPWHGVYAGLVLLGGALIVAVHVGVYPFGRLEWLHLALVLTLLFGAAAVVHVINHRKHRLGMGDPPELRTEGS